MIFTCLIHGMTRLMIPVSAGTDAICVTGRWPRTITGLLIREYEEREMTESDAAFDRALGAWEDRELNAHLAEEDRWDDANDRAVGLAWDSKLSELYEMAPVGVERKIEALMEDMIEHIAQLIMDNGGEI